MLDRSIFRSALSKIISNYIVYRMSVLDFSINDFKRQNLKPIKHRDIKQAILDLLGTSMAPPSPPIGITVSVPTKLSIKCRSGKRAVRRDYESLTPVEQYEYLTKVYVPRVITPFVDKGIFVPELTKQGNVHLHFICWDENVKDKFDMFCLQKTIGNSMLSYSITQGRRDRQVVLNYIHYLEDEAEWIKYMEKSQDDFKGKKGMPVYMFDGPIMVPKMVPNNP